MATKNYQITSVDDIKYKTLLYTECNKGKRFIYVYMLEEHLEKYLETGKSKFKIGQTDVRVGNRINDQIYHHGWQTITSSAPIIIAIYEVDNNINDKIIHSKICADVKNASISKFDERKSYHHAKSGAEWVNNISINDIENVISYYQGNFLFINNNALTNNYNITCNVKQSKYEFVNMLNNLVNSYNITKDRDIIKRYIQGIVISSIILGSDYKNCNILFGHKSFINMIEKLFNITFNDFMNKISYYERNYSDIDQMISMIHDYAMDNDLDLSWIAECFIDFTNGDNRFATNWKRMAAYYYADYLQEYIDKMDFDCKKNKDIKFLIYPGSLAIIDMIAEYRKIAIGNYNRKSEKIRYIVENEITLAFDFNDDFISGFVKQIIYYKYNVKLDNIIYITENSKIYNNKKELINMPKFDYIVQNPPYSGDLHLEFLKTGVDMLNEDGQMVIIEPARWLIDLRFATSRNKCGKYNSIKNKLNGIVKSITIENLNHEFNTALYVPFSITHIDKTYKNDIINFSNFGYKTTVTNILDVNLIGSRNIINSILNKVLSYNNMMSSHITNIDFNNLQIYYQKYLELIGRAVCRDGRTAEYWYRNDIYAPIAYWVANEDRVQISNTIPKCLKSGYTYNNPIYSDKNALCVYGTKDELNNWNNFIYNNTLPQFLNLILYIDQNNNSIEYLPWMVDKIYTDDEINKIFNFSEDEIYLMKYTIKKYKRNSAWFNRYMFGPSVVSDSDVIKYIESIK